MTSSKEIIEYFNEVDEEKKKNNKFIRDTSKGIFGVSNLNVLEKFFKQLKTNSKDYLVDLGSGDGRVNILASLHVKSTGIEFDKELVKESKEHNNKLETKAEFLEMDYEEFDFSKVTILFSFADHFFTSKFIDKLKKEFKGTLYVYQGVFTPEKIKKGKTFWIEQIPIISYQF